MIDRNSASGQPSFDFSISTRNRIAGLKGSNAIEFVNLATVYQSLQTQIARRLSQAGASVAPAIYEQPSDVEIAAYLYLGAATYAFESNPGYRYSAIRTAGRRLLMQFGIRPLSTELRLAGLPQPVVHYSVDEALPGSIKLKDVVFVGITGLGLAADIPTIATTGADFYADTISHAQKITSKYRHRYEQGLKEAGIDLESEPEPIEGIIPQAANMPPRRRRGDDQTK